MSTADTGASHQREPTQPAIKLEPFPPGCDPNQLLDWRFRVAGQLAEEADGQPPSHENVWIEEAARYLYAALHGDRDFTPSSRQRHFVKALDLCKRGALVRAILQARLLAGQTIEEIANKCTIDRLTIAAYATLLFDVSEPQRAASWFQSWRELLPRTDTKVWMVAMTVLKIAFSGDPKTLEDTVDVLCGLVGPTMGDGLPGRDAPEFLQVFGIRGAIAEIVLRPSNANARLIEQFYEARRSEPLSVHPVPVAGVPNWNASYRDSPFRRGTAMMRGWGRTMQESSGHSASWPPSMTAWITTTRCMRFR